MKVHVGTSGWAYRWNRGGLRGYVKNTPFDTVELNSSFYRVPGERAVERWAREGSGLLWSVKVYRGITHVSRFGPDSYEAWEEFKRVFKPLDPLIKFYLFQLPPSFGPKDFPKLEEFLKSVSLGRRAAVEFRNEDLFREDYIKRLGELEATFVSVDSTKFKVYARTGPYAYFRLHGRGKPPYAYSYSEEELEELAKEVLRVGGEAFVYFNNDDMYKNALTFLEIVKRFVEV
ncbi:DUF72 domain-containing protein [Ignicoccus hospitalis]|uniref:DUF72 domain-containing protein n=1 Tax=Ignicoccus hospitalis (strain KIN4/I / DSM 18386 / JCM 14125) TaxID=453591 RepID=A8AAX0_IGNH4|nr:DUF72 domain-containing protein [Ignicoccus hospitalis]ABU82072.1 protein of unknown function DUF72 [Ignicoccus hospitalis KIN4/I]HIH91029.1 DUF72 domain-containing protein [Desulfurococcaceae archaeon]